MSKPLTVFMCWVMAVAASGQTLDLNHAKTRKAKGDVPNTALIVTDIDGAAMGDSIAAFVNETQAAAMNAHNLDPNNHQDIRKRITDLENRPTGGGGGNVESVNGETGKVVITASSIDAASKKDLGAYLTKTNTFDKDMWATWASNYDDDDMLSLLFWYDGELRLKISQNGVFDYRRPDLDLLAPLTGSKGLLHPKASEVKGAIERATAGLGSGTNWVPRVNQSTQVYGTDTDGTPVTRTLNFHDQLLPWSIPYYREGATLNVGTPTAPNHAVNKQYFDANKPSWADTVAVGPRIPSDVTIGGGTEWTTPFWSLNSDSFRIFANHGIMSFDDEGLYVGTGAYGQSGYGAYLGFGLLQLMATDARRYMMLNSEHSSIQVTDATVNEGGQTEWRFRTGDRPYRTVAALDEIDSSVSIMVNKYLQSSNAWIYVTNDICRIYRREDTTNEYGELASSVTNIVWESQSLDQLLDAVDNEFIKALWTAINEKGSGAWGEVFPDGKPNPAWPVSVNINAPALVLMSGLNWATSGEYHVMAASGDVLYSSGTNGTIRTGPDLHNNEWVGWERRGSVIIGARIAGITYDPVLQVCRLLFPYAGGGEFPFLFYTPDLTMPFESLGTDPSVVSWVNNGDGTATATVDASAPRGFWMARNNVEAGVRYVCAAPVEFRGGVIYSEDSADVIHYNTYIIINQGGKNYKLPAEELP